MDQDNLSASSVSPQDQRDASTGKAASESQQQPLQQPGKDKKRLPACDNCKKRRLKCFPVKQPGSCPRCIDERVQCTTTPVVRRKPVRKPRTAPSSITAHSRQPTPETSVFEFDETQEQQQHPQAKAPLSTTTSQAYALSDTMWTPEHTRNVLRGKLAVQVLEAMTQTPCYAHPVLPIRSLLGELKTARYLPSELPIELQALVWCMFTHGAYNSISPAILGPDGPVPESYEALSKWSHADFEDLGRRRQPACQAILNEARRLAKEADITVVLSEANATSCAFLGYAEIVFGQDEQRGRAYMSAYYAHLRSLKFDSPQAGIRLLAYAAEDVLSSTYACAPLLFSEEDLLPHFGPSERSLESLLVNERKPEVQADVEKAWHCLLPILVATMRLIRRINRLSIQSTIDGPNEQDLAEVMGNIESLQEALTLVTKHIDRHVVVAHELFPSYLSGIHRERSGVLSLQAMNIMLLAVRRLVVASCCAPALLFYRCLQSLQNARTTGQTPPHPLSGAQIRQHERIDLLCRQMRDLSIECARVTAIATSKMPSLPHLTHAISIAPDVWVEFLLEQTAMESTVSPEDATALQSFARSMRMTMFSHVTPRRSALLSAIEARLQPLERVEQAQDPSAYVGQPFLDSTLLGLSVDSWDGIGDINFEQWINASNPFYGMGSFGTVSAAGVAVGGDDFAMSFSGGNGDSTGVSFPAGSHAG
ncbi:hypothetical protein ACM66B_001154 [Microbotryomycetes sp. NB124-2]